MDAAEDPTLYLVIAKLCIPVYTLLLQNFNQNPLMFWMTLHPVDIQIRVKNRKRPFAYLEKKSGLENVKYFTCYSESISVIIYRKVAW